MSASNHPSASSSSSRSKRVIIACTNCRKRKIRCLTSEQPPINPCERCAKKGLQCEYIPVPDQPDYSADGAASSPSHSGPSSSAPIHLSHPYGPPSGPQASANSRGGYSHHGAAAAHPHSFSGHGGHSQYPNPAANPLYHQQFIPNNPYIQPGQAAPYPPTSQPVYPDATGAYNGASNFGAQMANAAPYGWPQLSSWSVQMSSGPPLKNARISSS
ncbi:hypothetical protein C8R43DRAFT_943096 [Mycena crocata]|nr:hypothetical protein C8R43DRAFT_943096 [Mycena crocata]